MENIDQSYKWPYRIILIVWLFIFTMHANNFYIVDVREISALQWSGFVADTTKMSNSILYNSSAGGYGEHLLLSSFLSLICAALMIILIARRLLVALSLASHPVETRTAILAALIVFSTYMVPILFPSHDIFYLSKGTRMSGMPGWLKLFVITVGWPALTVMSFDLVVNPERSHNFPTRRS